MYDDLKKLQKLLWKHDDMMDQETLFELQELVAEMALKAAQAERKVGDLVKSFPWLYQQHLN